MSDQGIIATVYSVL